MIKRREVRATVRANVDALSPDLRVFFSETRVRGGTSASMNIR